MIKRELVLKLSKEHKINQITIANALDITKGSVTQYIQGKRASDSVKLRKISQLDRMIGSLAKAIAEKKLNQKKIGQEFCLICKASQKKLGIC